MTGRQDRLVFTRVLCIMTSYKSIFNCQSYATCTTTCRFSPIRKTSFTFVLVTDAEVAADGEGFLLDFGLLFDLGLGLDLGRTLRLALDPLRRSRACRFARRATSLPLPVRATGARHAVVCHLPVRTGGARRAVAFQLAVRAGFARCTAVFQPAVGAGGANRAAAFQPAVGAAGARGAAMFQLTVRAGAAHSTLALLPPMRASLHSHGSRATKPRALASARPGKSWSEVVVVAFEEIFFVSSQAIFLSSFFLPKRLASPPLFSSRRVRLRTRRARPRTLPCD